MRSDDEKRGKYKLNFNHYYRYHCYFRFFESRNIMKKKKFVENFSDITFVSLYFLFDFINRFVL